MFVVFDLTDHQSFDNAVGLWQRELERHASPEHMMALIGTKSDLAPTRRAVTAEEAQAAALRLKAVGYFEVSAASGNGVQEAFEECVRCRRTGHITGPTPLLPPVHLRPDALRQQLCTHENCRTSWCPQWMRRLVK